MCAMEFEEREETISLVGAFILLLSSILLIIFLGIGIVSITGVETLGLSTVGIQNTLGFMIFLSSVVTFFALMALIRKWIGLKINVFIAGICSLIIINMMYLIFPINVLFPTLNGTIQVLLWLDIFGVVFIFLAKRPKLGKESDKHIYQAYGAVIVFVAAICFLVLGIYTMMFDISMYAGNGTFPGGFEKTFLTKYESIKFAYTQIRASGVWMIVSSIILCVAAVIRKYITLRIASIAICVGIILAIIGIINFFSNWQLLDAQFENYYEDVYQGQLKLGDPFIVKVGVVLVIYFLIGLLMIVYASTQSEPLEKWKTRRNHFLAAAEVAIRDQKLTKAIAYLEKGAFWSSKLGEEDRAVELITRIHGIKEKAIKMRKSEAAEKKKKELDAAQKKAAIRKEETKPAEEKPEAKEEEKPTAEEEQEEK